ncbi:hypothetical protein AHAS_Ahas13G0520000 [Arachis hypogaea]
MTRREHQDQQSRVLCELSALVFSLLRNPLPGHLALPDGGPASVVPVPPSASAYRRAPEITPAGFASLLLGISVALMLCGSVTFLIGFMLMPWVLGLVMVFYVAGIVSTLSLLGRSLLCFLTPRKDVPGFSVSPFFQPHFRIWHRKREIDRDRGWFVLEDEANLEWELNMGP